MPSLIDIASATETVAGVQIHALSGSDIAELLGRFVQLRQLMTGVAVSSEDLVTMAPEAVAAVIASSTMTVREKADPEIKQLSEKAAASLAVGTQVDFLDAIIRLSIPSGISSFMERLAGLTAGLNGRGAVPATTSPKPSKN